MVRAGEVHAVMGPNGSGKSTLANVLAGRPGVEITQGSVRFEGRDLTALSPEERARAGIFLAFQYPVEIPGVANSYFLKASLNAIRKARGETELDAMDFLALVREKAKRVEMDEKFLQRAVNEGFSGGEKKRNEILQMAILEPRLAILDETDSGLDIDALRVVANGVNALRSPERALLVITHYQRLLDYIVPDFVHVLSDGRIVRSGGKELALELEQKGYGWLGGSGGAMSALDAARDHYAGSAPRLRGERRPPRPGLAALAARARPRRASPSRASRARGSRSGATRTWRRSRSCASSWPRRAASAVEPRRGRGARLPGLRVQRLRLRGRPLPAGALLAPRALAGACASRAWPSCARSAPERLAGRLGRLADPKRHPFVALGTAFLDDGACLDRAARRRRVAQPIHVVQIASGAAPDRVQHPRLLVVAEPESRVTLIQDFVSLSGARAFTQRGRGDRGPAGSARWIWCCSSARTPPPSTSRTSRRGSGATPASPPTP